MHQMTGRGDEICQLPLPAVARSGSQDTANLDDGDMWPVSYALQAWIPAVEKQVVELVRAAIS